MDIGFLALAQQCAPAASHSHLAAIVSVESGFNPFVIRVNSGLPLKRQPTTVKDAVEIASELIAKGGDIDLGLGGINGTVLSEKKIPLAEAFEPCTNLRLTDDLLAKYLHAAERAGAKSPLQHMLWTYYGRGDTDAGKLVGYDKVIEAQARRLEPRLGELTLAATASAALPRREGYGEPMADQPRTVEGQAGRQPVHLKATKAANPTREGAASAGDAWWDPFRNPRNSTIVIFGNRRDQ